VEDKEVGVAERAGSRVSSHSTQS